MKITREEFVKRMPECIEFLNLITPMLPKTIEELQPLVVYHPDREMCNRYCWSMLRNLTEYKFLKMSNGLVELP